MRLSRRPLVHKTQQTQQTNIHALSGIRAHNPSSLAAADVRLRPHGHRHHHVFITYLYVIPCCICERALRKFLTWIIAPTCYSGRKSLNIFVFCLTLNIPSLGRQRCLSSWGPRRTPWFFCNFSTVWCGRLLRLCFFLGFWNYNSVIQALLVSNILFIYFNGS